MTRPRIVLDTNVLISAALKPLGLEARVVELIAYRAVAVCLSEVVLAEYREVFARSKFSHLDQEHVSHLLTLVATEAIMVTPTEALAISKHDTDNRIYECAAAAEADYIVTGNTRHFPKPYKKIEIFTARQLLERLAVLPPGLVDPHNK